MNKLMNADWFKPIITDTDGKFKHHYDFPTSKVVCVGRNYTAHAKELNNPIPKSPLLFIKPNSSLVNLSNQINIPKNLLCHHELELAILIGKKSTNIEISQSINIIAGVGLALDLTLRDVQSQLKQKGQPWEIAKGFDGACPVSGFMHYSQASDLDLADLKFSMLKNSHTVQTGNSKDMIFSIPFLITEISKHFTLYPGDIILTGTPAGVGSLSSKDHLQFFLQDKCWAECRVTQTVKS